MSGQFGVKIFPVSPHEDTTNVANRFVLKDFAHHGNQAAQSKVRGRLTNGPAKGKGRQRKMTKIQFTTAVFAAAMGMIIITPGAKADDWDHKTIVTTSAPLNVAGTVLEPGKYVFQLLYTAPYEHVVQILNYRENHLYATVIAHPVGYMEQGIPSYDQGAQAGKAHFTFWETTAGEPKALRDWYNQGSFQGEEFPYHKMAVTQVSQVTQTTPAPAPEPQAEAPAPPPPAEEIAQNTPPPAPEPPAPAAEAPPAPQSEPPAAAPATLPQTASYVPLLAMFGFGSIGLAIGVGVFAKRMG
jgi:hypothetical protein